MLLSVASSASAATFTVTSNGDSGAGTLRQAITDSNANGAAEVDEIPINVTGNIDLLSQLPTISTPVTIDGPGAGQLNVTRSASASTEFRFFSISPATGNMITIRDLTISGARAGNSGGGALSMGGLGTLTIDSVVFSDNQSTSSGGAVFFNRGFTSIRNSTFTNNQADFGGAILGSQFVPNVGNGEIVNSTIAGNKATSFGGGMYTNVSHIQVLSSTIAGNVADSDDAGGGSGGGSYNGGADAAAFTVANTIYAGNKVGTTSPVNNQCGGAHTSSGYNLRSTSEVECTGFTGTEDVVNATPLIGSLGDNGGPTPTIPLLNDSPAIDAGNPAVLGAFPACPTTDQRGLLRGGAAGRCDIGAFELNASAPPSGGGTETGAGASPATVVPSFNLAAAVKKCKKKFPKGPKRKKCIKRAKRRAQT
jgi:predicted outer membrane repeat protein